jgi:hypothetical protein
MAQPLAERWEVVAPLGDGAMGSVARGRDTVSGRPVAIKRLLDVRHAARFEIEARLLMRLAHPRVVRVLDAFSDGAERYLVMELVEGEDLRTRLVGSGGRGVPAAEAVERVAEVCEALEYVHDAHVIHRDVKPSNVVVGPAGAVLVDFGVARDLGDAGLATQAIGTPLYMAPELAAGGAPSPRSDVYGAAATLHALVTGRPPEYGAVREALPDVPAYVTDALHAGLALDPSRRPPSAAAFAQLLGAAPAPERGRSLAASVGSPRRPAAVLEAVARAAAGIFDAAAASIALERPDGGLRFEAAWGAGADEIVGVELEAGAGIVGSVALGGRPLAIADCRADPRFASAVAAGTGYVPHTLLAVPLRLGERVIGVLELLDRRDGEPYRDADAAGAQHLATIAAAALGEAASQTPTVAG